MEKKRSKVIIIFGILIIVSSLLQMHKLVFEYERCREVILACLPEWLVAVRYCFSWFQRILGLTIAIGILRLNNTLRKLGIVFGIFVICTVYWKHPYPAFLSHANYLDQQVGQLLAAAPGITFSSLTRISMIGHCILDIVFWSIFIYYFTRPIVKEQFK